MSGGLGQHLLRTEPGAKSPDMLSYAMLSRSGVANGRVRYTLKGHSS